MEPQCGGGLLLSRHVTPLARRNMVYFSSGAYMQPRADRRALAEVQKQTQLITEIGEYAKKGMIAGSSATRAHLYIASRYKDRTQLNRLTLVCHSPTASISRASEDSGMLAFRELR